MELRYYQREAVDSAFEFLKKDPSSGTAIDLHTGAGKSVVIAELIRKITNLGLRCICLVDRGELVKQNKAQMIKILNKNVSVGAFCSSVGEKEIDTQVVMASVQSLHSAMKKDKNIGGVFKLIIVDECHMIKPDDVGMYRSVVKNLRERTDNTVGLVGLTATPYRMDSGYITAGDDSLFKTVCYSYSLARGLEDGYAAPLITNSSSFQYSDEGMSVSKKTGDYTAKSLQLISDQDNITEQAVANTYKTMIEDNRKHALIFCANISHVDKVEQYFKDQANSNQQKLIFRKIHSKQDSKLNEENIRLFKEGRINGLINCDALTTGFDAPFVDTIGIMRKIGSIPLWVQILGRGVRIFEGKLNCLVLDYGGNIQKMPPLLSIGAKFEAQAAEKTKRENSKREFRTKACPNCKVDNIPFPTMTCPICEFKFENLLILSGVASVADILYGDLDETALRYLNRNLEIQKITKVSYSVHHKQVGFNKFDKSSKPTLRCDFRNGLSVVCSNWLCFEHGGFMVDKAMRYVDAVSPYTMKQKIINVNNGLSLSREWVQPAAVICKKVQHKGKIINKFVGLIVGRDEKIVDFDEYKREYYTQKDMTIVSDQLSDLIDR